MTIYGILLIIVVLLWVTQMEFEFEIDHNTETGDLLLWYNGKKGREHIILIPHQIKLW